MTNIHPESNPYSIYQSKQNNDLIVPRKYALYNMARHLPTVSIAFSDINRHKFQVKNSIETPVIYANHSVDITACVNSYWNSFIIMQMYCNMF